MTDEKYFMENAMTVSVTPIQLLLSFVFQAWIIIFPIIIIRKLNFLIDLLQEDGDDELENS